MSEPRSVYNIGANDGLLMGLYLSVMFILQSVGLNHNPLLFVGHGLMLAIPIVTYILLKRGYRLSGYIWTFAGVWLHGIVMFLCGSLILAIVVYAYMRFINPEFIYQQFMMLIDAYNSIDTSDAQNMAEILGRMIDRHLLPTPISIAFGMIWLVGFLGAMLSMAIAFIIKYLVKPRKNTV